MVEKVIIFVRFMLRARDANVPPWRPFRPSGARFAILRHTICIDRATLVAWQVPLPMIIAERVFHDVLGLQEEAASCRTEVANEMSHSTDLGLFSPRAQSFCN